jgi:outer membrane protein insertion porin family
MTEAPAQSVNASGGFSRDLGVYGSLNYGNLNQGGRGQQLSGNVLLGTRDIQVNGQFVRPYRATEPDKLGLRVEGFRQRTDSRTLESTTAPNGDRIREGRFGGSVSVNRPMGEWDASLGLNYQRISLRDQAGNVVPQDAQGRSLSASGTGIDDLTTLNLTAVRDKRNNVIDPTQGSLLRLSTEQSVPIGSGSILSNRVSVNFSEYMPVNLFNLEKTQQQPEVFAYNLQAGTTLGTLPAYNAFALGGPNSVRGYGEGQLGAARSYVAASAEYRFPIYSIVGGAVFADVASNLSTNTGFGAGLGLRLKSPVGTIRASYGFNDRGEGRIQFGIGEKF